MNKSNLITFPEQVKAADDPLKALLEDMQKAHDAGDNAGVLRIAAKIQGMTQTEKEIKPVSARHYLQEEPPAADQLLIETFDLGDKIVIIGSSKQRKSFFILQMAMSLAAGLDFLTWKNRIRRRVLLIQFEIKEAHFHKRVRNMADALDIDIESLDDNLLIINARGLGINGTDGILKLIAIAKAFGAEVIIFDPLYKLMGGNENSTEAFKPILDAFDSLAEDTGAAIGYVHHDAKGAAGDRAIQDRGAGSNILGRDYDACIALSPHRSEKNVTVVETLVRNYRPRPEFCIEWSENPSGQAACFVTRPGLEPIKTTTASLRQSNNSTLPLSIYETPALNLVDKAPLPITVFKYHLRHDLKMTCIQAKTFVDWATDPEIGKLGIYENRGRAKNIKLIGLPDQIKSLSAGTIV